MIEVLKTDRLRSENTLDSWIKDDAEQSVRHYFLFNVWVLADEEFP